MDSRQVAADHPRIRGEKFRIKQVGHDRKGSPPHTRGKVYERDGQPAEKRITPAYAGKSRTLL